MARIARFFFMHVGSFVPVITYVVVLGGAGPTPAGVRHALAVALTIMTGYVALAWSQAELKQFDVGLWAMFALGMVASLLGIDPIVALFAKYFGAVLFTTLATTALVPLLLGRETFTYYFARRQIPAWQLKLPEFDAISRVMTAYWTVLFLTAAGLCAWAPLDWRFTLLYPNLLIFGLGMSATVWLPPLYLAVFPPSQPRTIEPLIMGMPFAFDRRAARDARASIQFCVSGDDAGDYHVNVARGRCRAFEGRASAPDLTIYTPDTVWVRVVLGELDGGQALAEGLYRAEGDPSLLVKLGEWFPARRPG
jgi:SCP-2 sterol transfer family